MEEGRKKNIISSDCVMWGMRGASRMECIIKSCLRYEHVLIEKEKWLWQSAFFSSSLFSMTTIAPRRRWNAFQGYFFLASPRCEVCLYTLSSSAPSNWLFFRLLIDFYFTIERHILHSLHPARARFFEHLATPQFFLFTSKSLIDCLSSNMENDREILFAVWELSNKKIRFLKLIYTLIIRVDFILGNTFFATFTFSMRWVC